MKLNGYLPLFLRITSHFLLPSVESDFKEWGSCWPHAGNTAPGERLSKVIVMLRAKFSNYLKAIVEKLVENDIVVASDLTRLQPLKDQLANTVGHLHSVFDTRVFISICLGYSDRMGREIEFLGERKREYIMVQGFEGGCFDFGCYFCLTDATTSRKCNTL